MTIQHIDKGADQIVFSILKATEELNNLKDVDTILDKILFESRKLTNADAGSIFLVKDNSLTFSYVHNDTLFKKDSDNAEIYKSFKVPINDQSIVGYSALKGENISIDDAYTLNENLPYNFNPSFDKKTGYKTTSILTIPLKTIERKIVGVMQLINAANERGKTIPFSKEHIIYLPLFASNASIAIERGIMNRELILRMVKMAELKDPTETGTHVQRVGAYCAEIYQKWAKNRNIEKSEIKKNMDVISLASMLHDVGKVGITDFILKKPGKLTNEEFDVMKWHTVYGARLFVNITSPLDQMSKDIALNHHEKWAGGGYPGKLDDLFTSKVKMGKTKKGEEIPLAARITALADVYDALSSKRSYKDPWPEEKIIKTIEKDSGVHFDPEVVTAFFEIFDVIKAIRDKFSDDIK